VVSSINNIMAKYQHGILMSDSGAGSSSSISAVKRNEKVFFALIAHHHGGI
jgi:hypothetical protein